MIVAYDLRYASDHFVGIGTHAHALIEALLDLPGEERYVLLWDPAARCTRFDLARLRSHPRVEWVERRFHPIRPDGALRVGAWLRRLRPAVYLSPFFLRPFASGCPEVVTVHDVWPLRLPAGLSRLRLALYRASLWHTSGAARIATPSDFSRGEVLALTSLRPERVRTIRQGYAPPVRSPELRRPRELAEERFALIVGDNRPHKNLALLARAWAALGPEPPLALVAAGPAEARFPSLALLAEKAGARRVRHLGWLEPAELAWLYAHAEFVLFPSRYEGFGFPLVEAFAAGAPVLASDLAVFREIGEGAAAFADPLRPEAWTEGILRLAGDPDARARLRDAGRARIPELSYRRTAEQMRALLREAAGLAPPA